MRLRFTIRDLFWLTAVMALAIGWWLDHSRWRWYYDEAANRATQMAIERDAGQIEFNKKLLEYTKLYRDARIEVENLKHNRGALDLTEPVAPNQ